MPNGDRPNAAETKSSDTHENEADYIITRDKTNYADRAAHSRNQRINDDVTERNESSEAPRIEETDWPNPAVYPKKQENFLPNTDEGLKNDENFSERYTMNENDAKNSSIKGDDIIVPEISESDARNEI